MICYSLDWFLFLDEFWITRKYITSEEREKYLNLLIKKELLLKYVKKIQESALLPASCLPLQYKVIVLANYQVE